MIVADRPAIVAIVFAALERQVFLRVNQSAPHVLFNDMLRLPMFEVIPPGAAKMDAAYAAFWQ